MHSFQHDRMRNMHLPSHITVVVGKIRELKGRQALFEDQQPQILKNLRKSAIIESVESSNRIEQITAPRQRIATIVQRNAKPRNRSEAEIAGYKHVLETIHASGLNIPRTTSVALQLHRDLYRYLEGRGGFWKRAENHIKETLPDGTERIRFLTVPALETPSTMESLHNQFNAEWDNGAVERLVLIPAYILDFLSIHPFPDGNGRMARLLALLFLYHDGFEVGRYISLEKQIEDTKEGYYDTLKASSVGWHNGTHDPIPFIDYFLSVVLLPAYQRFATQVEARTIKRGAKQDAVISAIHHAPGEFQIADIEHACPGVSRATITRVLQQQRRDGLVKCIQYGRDALWQKKL